MGGHRTSHAKATLTKTHKSSLTSLMHMTRDHTNTAQIYTFTQYVVVSNASRDVWVTRVRICTYVTFGYLVWSRRGWSSRCYGCIELHRIVYRAVQEYRELPRDAHDPSKLTNFKLVDPFWVSGTFCYMLTSILPNSHFGKRPGAQDMAIEVSVVLPYSLYRIYGDI